MQIHEMIMQARLSAGLTQDQLAKKIGIKRSTYQYWEQETTSIENIHKVAKALGLPDDYFFVKQGEIPKEKVPITAPEEDLLKRAILNMTEDKLESTAVIKRLTGLLELQAQVYLSQLSKSNQVVTSPESEASPFQDLNPNGGKQKKAGKQ